MLAQIGNFFVDGRVDIDTSGQKTADISAVLPGLEFFNVEVGSINHLFHFVVSISDGSSLDLIADSSSHGGGASVGFPGGMASIQGALSATVWVYATTEMPGVELGTAVRLFGDYNDDGVVDAGDYVTWRNSLGQTGADLPADGDGNNAVDLNDYRIWQLTYGLTVDPAPGSGGLATVPEPTSLDLWLILLAAAYSVCRSCGRHRRHRAAIAGNRPLRFSVAASWRGDAALTALAK